MTDVAPRSPLQVAGHHRDQLVLERLDGGGPLYSFDYLLEGGDAPEGEPEGLGVHTAADGRLFPLYSDEVPRGVELECRRRGLALMLGAGHRNEHLPAVVDVAGRIDGLIAFAGAAPADALARIVRRIPLVELGGEVHAPGVHTVLVDNRAGMQRLVEHFLHDHGYRRFVYIGAESTPEFVARFCATSARGSATPG
jgi:DNA-binding LacI/PurR family transcriptional regulator